MLSRSSRNCLLNITSFIKVAEAPNLKGITANSKVNDIRAGLSKAIDLYKSGEWKIHNGALDESESGEEFDMPDCGDPGLLFTFIIITTHCLSTGPYKGPVLCNIQYLLYYFTTLHEKYMLFVFCRVKSRKTPHDSLQ